MRGTSERRAVTGLSRFKPYPEYKDSGIDWLGEIPAHWKIVRVSGVTTLVNGYPFDSEYFVRGGGTPLVRIRDLYDTETEISYTGPVVESAWITTGDLIIGMDGDFNVARWRGPRALLNQRMCCLRPRAGADVGFIAHLLPFPLRVINDLTYSTTVKHLSSVDIRKILLASPPVEEQRAIAAFLDWETAKIDALVAKKEQVIELLTEKRTALITQAVTKGLDPNVSMKDSGVEWLGEIPAHWEVKGLKRLASLRAGTAITADTIEEVGEFPVFGGNGIRGFTTSYTHDGDFPLIGRQGALCGSVNFASGKFWASEHAVVAAPQDEVDPYWLAYLLRAMSLNSYSESAAQPGLAVDTISALHVPTPSMSEQRAVRAFLDQQTGRIDSLVTNVDDAISRLKELRSALISAAVTGKINVREETT